MKPKSRKESVVRRHLRVRRKVSGTAERPRLCVHVSNKHMRVQFVDDMKARTLAAYSTLTPAVKEKVKGKNNLAAAKELGAFAGKAAGEKGITAVVFDRGGFAYKGRVKAIAEAARGTGLKF